jgi:putative salt-induced outer membrane protein YdiY
MGVPYCVLRRFPGGFQKRFWMALVLSALASAVAWAGSDTLMTITGDRLVGTVEKLERGVLHFDTDYADDVFTLEWKQVRWLSSQTFLVIELSSGERFFGTIRADSSVPDRALLGGQRLALYSDIVAIFAVEQGFWNRLEASVDLGYTLTKANNSQQFTAQAGATYRTEDWQYAGKYMVVHNEIDDAPKTRKIDGSIDTRLRVVNRWFAFLGGAYGKSDEQRLDARYSVNGGAGNYLIATPAMDLLVSAGLTWMAEEFLDPDVPNNKTLEGLFKVEYNAFDIDPLSILTKVSVSPNLQDKKRVRGNFKIDFKWDLPLDFTFKVGFTVDYDSKPPNEASKSDYVLSTTFGWEF